VNIVIYFRCLIAGLSLLAVCGMASALIRGEHQIYYIDTAANGCNDSNVGSSGSPWCTPNHVVNPNDIVYVKPGNYSVNWSTGVVNGAGYAYLYCQTYFACNLTGSDYPGPINIQNPYWVVEGFNVTAPSAASNSVCIVGNGNQSVSLHHVIVRNNVISGCIRAGIVFAGYGAPIAADYITIESNIVYNAGQSYANTCESGIDIFKPTNFDNAAGVHILIKRNFVYSNINTYHSGNTYCGGTNTTTDGEGIILDTWGTSGYSYTGQTIIESNIGIGNGSSCILAFVVNTSPTIVRNNTCWANNVDPHLMTGNPAELRATGATALLQSYNNIGQATSATITVGRKSLYAAQDTNTADPAAKLRDIWDENVFIGVSGNNTAYGKTNPFRAHNLIGTDPHFANPAVPGAPNCSGQPDVATCLRNVDGAGFDVIARFTPTNNAIKGVGSLSLCAPVDITGTAWAAACDPGAIKWSTP
jgi:hypothetical protein